MKGIRHAATDSGYNPVGKDRSAAGPAVRDAAAMAPEKANAIRWALRRGNDGIDSVYRDLVARATTWSSGAGSRVGTLLTSRATAGTCIAFATTCTPLTRECPVQ